MNKIEILKKEPKDLFYSEAANKDGVLFIETSKCRIAVNDWIEHIGDVKKIMIYVTCYAYYARVLGNNKSVWIKDIRGIYYAKKERRS